MLAGPIYLIFHLILVCFKIVTVKSCYKLHAMLIEIFPDENIYLMSWTFNKQTYLYIAPGSYLLMLNLQSYYMALVILTTVVISSYHIWAVLTRNSDKATEAGHPSVVVLFKMLSQLFLISSERNMLVFV